jgi:hypothetical protein
MSMPIHTTRDSNSERGEGEPSNPLLRGRACYERREWNDAFEALSLADQSTPLDAEDLHRLAWSAGLTARDEQMLATQERVYHARLEAGQKLVAARAAFWLGFRLLARAEPGRASGWLSRAQRLVELHAEDCVEQGYLLLPAGQRHLSTGEFVEAHDCAARAALIGERFGEVDLIAFARNLQGRALLSQGRIASGLVLMDEAMVAATSGELSPIVAAALLNLCRHPEQLKTLQRNPELIPAAFEECLRYHGPSYLAFARFAKVDTVVGGTTILKNMHVQLSWQAANYDPVQYPNPLRFDIHRDPKRTLVFGMGPHHCLGNRLARRILQINLRNVLRRFRNLHLVEPDRDPVGEAQWAN